MKQVFSMLAILAIAPSLDAQEVAGDSTAHITSIDQQIAKNEERQNQLRTVKVGSAAAMTAGIGLVAMWPPDEVIGFPVFYPETLSGLGLLALGGTAYGIASRYQGVAKIELQHLKNQREMQDDNESRDLTNQDAMVLGQQLYDRELVAKARVNRQYLAIGSGFLAYIAGLELLNDTSSPGKFTIPKALGTALATSGLIYALNTESWPSEYKAAKMARVRMFKKYNLEVNEDGQVIATPGMSN